MEVRWFLFFNIPILAFPVSFELDVFQLGVGGHILANKARIPDGKIADDVEVFSNVAI